ncbi:acetyltransferase [Strigomonas culicis]|uniref:Acetyltransferase n=1 Tax=Strigomonas culicis TaxID=28005 RepID=S9UJS0_9TRYP|nr:N-acetyltransferase [Strigomonas culicis]EPY31262.1 acetyltransferase [Strigomonas culicis]EPY33658.1 acetyltransferase [Strigomonas culicis]|eukprot:EPY29024.1 N-acetyltransferase [Strigomonas culicis]
MAEDFLPPELPPVKGLCIRTFDDPRIAERIRVLDQHCLPVRYAEKYYDMYVRGGMHGYNQLAYFHDLLIGSINCRLEPTDEEETHKLYIMTITVLEPYRRMKVGSHLLRRIMDMALHEARFRVSEVALNVQVGSPALHFYESFGFTEVELVKDYYTDLDVKDAYLLHKVVPQTAANNKQQQKKKKH